MQLLQLFIILKLFWSGGKNVFLFLNQYERTGGDDVLLDSSQRFAIATDFVRSWTENLK